MEELLANRSFTAFLVELFLGNKHYFTMVRNIRDTALQIRETMNIIDRDHAIEERFKDISYKYSFVDTVSATSPLLFFALT